MYPKVLMLDTETFDTATTAEVAEVAIVLRDYTGCNKPDITLHYYTKPPQDLSSLFSISGKTLVFHEEQKDGFYTAYKKAESRKTYIEYEKLITQINNLLLHTDSDTMIYCFGLNFDIPLLTRISELVGIPLNFKSYRNFRCLRTELATAEKLGMVYTKPPAKHNAMDDVLDQLQTLEAIFNFYKGIKNGNN